MRKYLTVAALGILLTGCGEKSDFEKAINEKSAKTVFAMVLVKRTTLKLLKISDLVLL